METVWHIERRRSRWASQNEMYMDSITELNTSYNSIFTKCILPEFSLNCFSILMSLKGIKLILFYPHCSQNMETTCPCRMIHWFESSILNLSFTIQPAIRQTCLEQKLIEQWQTGAEYTAKHKLERKPSVLYC